LGILLFLIGIFEKTIASALFPIGILVFLLRIFGFLIRILILLYRFFEKVITSRFTLFPQNYRVLFSFGGQVFSTYKQLVFLFKLSCIISIESYFCNA
jgi:hypothetical protein